MALGCGPWIAMSQQAGNIYLTAEQEEWPKTGQLSQMAKTFCSGQNITFQTFLIPESTPSFTQTPSLRLLKEPVMKASLNLTWPSDVIMVLRIRQAIQLGSGLQKSLHTGGAACLPSRPTQSAFQIFPGRCTGQGGWR